MKNYFRHLLTNPDQLRMIATKSFLNCHVLGLHSIMLTAGAGSKLIRLYIAEPKNSLTSLGIHPHHCNLSLEVIKGRLTNRVYTVDGGSDRLKQFRFVSPITNEGPGSFKLLKSVVWIGLKEKTELGVGQMAVMAAKDLHTVSTSGHWCSWLVYEGDEDPDYDPICYHSADLTQWTGSHLYQRPTPQQVTELLLKAGLL